MKIKHSALVSSSLEQVWNRTIDFDNWSTWNPNIKSSKANFKNEPTVGDTFTLEQPGMGTVQWTISTIENQQSCSWETLYQGDKMIARHELSLQGDKVLNKIELEIEGRGFKSIIHKLLYPLYKLALKRENKGFVASFEKS